MKGKLATLKDSKKPKCVFRELLLLAFLNCCSTCTRLYSNPPYDLSYRAALVISLFARFLNSGPLDRSGFVSGLQMQLSLLC